MNDVIIKAENISKYYRLGQLNSGAFYRDLQSWFARKKGKEDPNAKIDARISNKEGFWALDDVNFEIQRGDRVGVIGRNGAGKSTLLKILSQVTEPTKGRIGINGRVASLLEVGTGFHPEMTGRENIYLNGSILGMKRAEINEKLKQIIDFSEIEEYIDTPVKRYSSGMYVRLAFAVAAHLDSEILIADEVLAVGDLEFQKKALGKMNDLSTGQGRTVLFVSHQLSAVKSLCNKGIILDHGKIAFNGEVSEALKKYNSDMYRRSEDIDLSEYSNKYFDIVSFLLIDEDGNELEQPNPNNKKMYVKFILNMKRVDPEFKAGYHIYNDEGDLIYMSYYTDGIIDNKIHVGENELIGEIPNHFLNEGDYNIFFDASRHCVEPIVNAFEKAPCIRLSIRGGLSNSTFWVGKREGICAPILKWKINR